MTQNASFFFKRRLNLEFENGFGKYFLVFFKKTIYKAFLRQHVHNFYFIFFVLNCFSIDNIEFRKRFNTSFVICIKNPHFDIVIEQYIFYTNNFKKQKKSTHMIYSIFLVEIKYFSDLQKQNMSNSETIHL